MQSSTAFVHCGFQALAVDHVTSPKFRTFLLDLTLEPDQQVLLELISIHRPFLELEWLAPPCGTASLAKNIPVFDVNGRPVSQPLRSTEFPDGLCGLQGIDLDRILASNTLHELCERVCALCDLLDLRWIIENPLDSLIWSTSFLKDRHVAFKKTFFQNCMYGGTRPKKTSLLANSDISSLKAVL